MPAGLAAEHVHHLLRQGGVDLAGRRGVSGRPRLSDEPLHPRQCDHNEVATLPQAVQIILPSQCYTVGKATRQSQELSPHRHKTVTTALGAGATQLKPQWTHQQLTCASSVALV